MPLVHSLHIIFHLPHIIPLNLELLISEKLLPGLMGPCGRRGDTCSFVVSARLNRHFAMQHRGAGEAFGRIDDRIGIDAVVAISETCVIDA